MMKKILLCLTLCFFTLPFFAQDANAQCCRGCRFPCSKTSQDESKETIKHITDEFLKHREWMIKEFWEARLLPALMLMTEQMTAAAMLQVQIIGTFFDAKHQLETQRLFQELAAQAHKDYQPSEGLCTIGTNVRSLAASDRNAEFSAEVISTRNIVRQTLNGDSVSSENDYSDRQSRFAHFLKTYCNPKDNANGLDLLCGSGGPVKRRNKDVDFTTTLDAPLTLGLDFADGSTTPDEEDIFALAANLYAHQPPALIGKTFLSIDANGKPSTGANYLQDVRAVIAKRSVAQNSFAAIAAQKARGEPEVEPYLYKILEEMGIPEDDIKNILGERPSYFAQMEVLTKKIYQNPNFYTDLYDKPANVKRKEVAMQAIDLMQKRDMFRSLLRSEANLSIMLETLVADQQRVIENEVNPGSR